MVQKSKKSQTTMSSLIGFTISVHKHAFLYLQKIEEYQLKLQEWIIKNGSPLDNQKVSPFTFFSSELESQSGKKLKRKKVERVWREASDELKNTLKNQLTCPDPVNSVSAHHFLNLNLFKSENL